MHQFFDKKDIANWIKGSCGGSQKAIFCQKLWEHNCMIYCLPVPWYSVLLGVSKFSKRTVFKACFGEHIHLGSDDGNIGHLHFLIKAFEICISV